VDEKLGLRLREVHIANREKPTEQTQSALELITTNQKKVRLEIDSRKETLRKLVTRLEERQAAPARPAAPAPSRGTASPVTPTTRPQGGNPPNPQPPAQPGNGESIQVPQGN
jgi:hypothetical protein